VGAVASGGLETPPHGQSDQKLVSTNVTNKRIYRARF